MICSHVDLEDIHSFGDYWVVVDEDGAWQTRKDCNGEPVFYPAKDKYKLAINDRLSTSDEISREEELDRLIDTSDEYKNMRGYNEKNYIGMEGAFDVTDFRNFEL